MGNYVFGPAMIPDKEIYRNPNKAVNEPHYVMFSTKTIEQLRTKFHANKFDNKVNINHDGIAVNEVIMTKSFLLNKNNRNSIPENFTHLPDGTWMIEYEIENDGIWSMIEEKKINGFSVEGVFQYANSSIS
ncbi:MAG: hypothetical protein IPI93_14480 [Sphingobacteriaceae bacterium]|nr:hypothetical protein [Sphingobacteriaceae bacterium]